MDLERIKSWAAVVLPALLLLLFVLGYGQLRAIQADLREARRSIDAADRSVRSVAEELRGMQGRLGAAQDSIRSIRADIRTLNREVAGRVQGLDRRIGAVRESIQAIDAQIARRLAETGGDSLEAPVFIERPDN